MALDEKQKALEEKEKTLEKEKQELIQKMLDINLSISDIIKITGLSKKEIQELKK